MTRTNPKPATCEKCNSTDVAWAKSKRTGKFYLTEVFTDSDGDRVTARNDFHSKYCGKSELHDSKQAGYNGYVKPEVPPQVESDLAQEVALVLSGQPTMAKRVVEISKFAKNNPDLSRKVIQIWERQGENLLAEVMTGALGE